MNHDWQALMIDFFWIMLQYSKFVKPAFDDFILPTKKYADIIIPRGGDNHVAVDLIVQHIRTKLGQHDLCKIYPNLYVIQTTFQVMNFILTTILLCILGKWTHFLFSFIDTGHAYSYSWCTDNKTWLCFLCWSVDTLGKYFFRPINLIVSTLARRSFWQSFQSLIWLF